MAACKLSDLAPGASAVVRGLSVQAGPMLRLLEMGLLLGTRLTLMRSAPLGDPILVRLRGYLLSLRKADAAHVLVEVN